MSFAGHVFDMIRRNKENREWLNQRRQHYKDMQRKMMDNSQSMQNIHVTLAEFERIERELQEKEKQDRIFRFRINSCIVVAIVLITLLVLAVVAFLL